MITLASQQNTVYARPAAYVSSESGMSQWGQPPASHYVFSVQGNHLVGHLIQDKYQALRTTVSATTTGDPLLDLDFKAWEKAGDEDWLKFEAQLD